MKSPKLLKRLKNNLTIAVVCLLAACQGNTIYHSYQPVPTEGWAKSDTLVYTLPDSIQAGNYLAEINIRCHESYPYRNLWLAIDYNLQDSLTFTTDTLQLFVANIKGEKAENSPGRLHQYILPYDKLLSISQKSGRSFYIRQLMADSLLTGVSDAGIHLQKAE